MPTTHPTLSRKMNQKEFKEFRKTLPETDRRFFRTMVVLQTSMKLTDFSYSPPPPEMERRLRRYGPQALFSIVVDCVALLTGTLAMNRVKDIHRSRSAVANAETRPVDANGRRPGTRPRVAPAETGLRTARLGQAHASRL